MLAVIWSSKISIEISMALLPPRCPLDKLRVSAGDDLPMAIGYWTKAIGMADLHLASYQQDLCPRHLFKRNQLATS